MLKSFKEYLQEGDVVPFKKKEAPVPPEHQGYNYKFTQIHGSPKQIEDHIKANHPHLLKHISGVGKQLKFAHKVMKMSRNPVNNTGWHHDGYLIRHADGSDTGVDLTGKHYEIEKVPLG